MTGSRTSELTAITSLATDDELPIVDTSALTTKRVTVAMFDARYAAPITVSGVSPVSPAEGDLWFNSDTATLYVYYDAVWVAV